MMPGLFRSWISIAVLCVSVFLVAGCTSATAGLDSIPTVQSQVYRLVAGDKIRISIPDLQGADGEYLIDQTGAISLPLANEVKVAGLSLRDAENRIEQVLQEKQILVRPNVTVQPVALRPIYVLGEVNKPGEYDFREGMTIFSVVSLAGGYTYRADTKSMMIIRSIDGRTVTGKAEEDTIVMPGDQIRIVEKWF